MAPTKPRLRGPRWTPLGSTLALLALSIMITGGIFAGMLWQTSALLTGQVLQVIGAEARGFNEQYRIGGLPLLVQNVSERAKLPGNGLYLVVDGHGTRLAGNLESYPEAIRDQPGGGPFRYQSKGHDGTTQQRLAIGLPIRVPAAEQQPGALLLVARDVEDINAYARYSRSLFLAGIGLMSALALAGALLHARAIGRRVDTVTSASRRIMSGDLSERLPTIGTGDEIDRLSTNLNVMLSRIEELMQSLREVSDNIAHDLKTPLTRLRNRAEAALRDSRGSDAYREGLERTLDEADEIIKTFNALLSIARLEAGTGAEQMQMIDVAEVVRETVELYEPVAEEAGLHIHYAGPDMGAPAKADRQLVVQAVVNLIENAIKYGCNEAGRGGQRVGHEASISVTVSERAGYVDTAISDRGPGIPEGDRERVVKRFVRLETSRTRPGTGLGLSLVAAVARLHQGTLRLEDNAPGLRAVLSLPRWPRGA